MAMNNFRVVVRMMFINDVALILGFLDADQEEEDNID